MKERSRLALRGCLTMGVLLGLSASARSHSEVSESAQWFAAHFARPNEMPPFSFRSGGKPFAETWKTWEVERQVNKLDAERTEHIIRYLDRAAGLAIRCVAIEYHDFPTLEWTLYFRNIGPRESPLLADIQALDTRFQHPDQGELILHHHRGSLATKEDYRPIQTILKPQTNIRIAPSGGRPTNGNFSYFNVAWPRAGVIVVIGWPGQWAAEFRQDAGVGLRVRAGQELTHFRLQPGEEVRTPLIVLQFWKGDRLGAQNVWRRWMMAHSMPRPGGKLPAPQLAACSSHQFGEMIHANEANQKLFIDRYLAEGIKLDYWWMDAGWYVNQTGWTNTGTWEVDPKRFPHGLRAITDHAHARGVKSLVWFEPERVTPGSWLFKQHPEWLLRPPSNSGPRDERLGQLLDLGNPDARKWLTDHVDRLLTEQGIDLYRQDFNIDPLDFWRAHDAPERQGITEIRYVSGYLAYWDELRRRHPNMLIDSCASGGRRNDLETMRRAVPLTRSDELFEPVGQQCQTYGIAFWIPYYGGGVLAGPSAIGATASTQVNPYEFRSDLYPSLTACWDVRRKDLDYALIRLLLSQWRRIAPSYLRDYYPLTPYSTAQNVWMAWQFGSADAGVVQAFRRSESPRTSLLCKLHGLEPEGRYRTTNLDSGSTLEVTGRQLMAEGVAVAIQNQPGAAILLYQKQR